MLKKLYLVNVLHSKAKNRNEIDDVYKTKL